MFEKPKMCFAELRSTGETIIIHFGESGYHPLNNNLKHGNPMSLNANLGVTEAEMKAMEICSMFDCWNKYEENVIKFKEQLSN